jgi:pyruvate kinase
MVSGGARAQDAADYVAGLVVAGMDVARLNLSHARGVLDYLAGRAPDYSRELASMGAVRRAAETAGRERHVGVLLDLQGVKIRLKLPESRRLDGVPFAAGDEIRMRLTLDPAVEDLACDASDATLEAVRAAVAEKGTIQVAFGDGDVVLVCEAVDGDAAVLRAAGPGVLLSRKSVSFRGVDHPDEPPLPLRDRVDLVALALPCVLRGEADFIALSFTRSVADIRALRRFGRSAIAYFRDGEEPDDEQNAALFQRLKELCPDLPERYAESPDRIRFVAKLETRAATQNLDGILAEAHAVMISRGDLGMQCEPQDVPRLQKDIIRRARLLGGPAIVATQMLGSMEHAPEPQRAEAADVFNAVLDGADALMLSAETAIGTRPHAAVRTLRTIADTAEDWDVKRRTGRGFHLNMLRQQIEALRASQQRTPGWLDVTDRLTLEAVRIAEGLGLDAIVAATRSGQTARHVARFDPQIPVIAIVPSARTARQLALVGSVRAVVSDVATLEEALADGLGKAVRSGMLEDGTRVLVVAARDPDPRGASTILAVRRVRVDTGDDV